MKTSEEMSIKQQQKKNWIHLAGCDWSQLLQFQPEIENCRVRFSRSFGSI